MSTRRVEIVLLRPLDAMLARDLRERSMTDPRIAEAFRRIAAGEKALDCIVRALLEGPPA